MAVVTAAVIGTVATVGATAASMAMQPSGGGGGSAPDPKYKNAPQDPLDRAMRSYYGRAVLSNATKTYPAFNEYLASGGDPEKAKFDLDMPAMTPFEASAFKYVGPHGKKVEQVPYESTVSGETKNLTPEQILYLAKERRQIGAGQGTPTPWASGVLKTNKRLGKVEDKLAGLAGVTDPTGRQLRQVDRLTGRQAKLTEKQNKYLNPETST